MQIYKEGNFKREFFSLLIAIPLFYLIFIFIFELDFSSIVMIVITVLAITASALSNYTKWWYTENHE